MSCRPVLQVCQQKLPKLLCKDLVASLGKSPLDPQWLARKFIESHGWTSAIRMAAGMALRPTCPTSCQIDRCSYSMQSGFAAYLSFSALGMLDQKSSSDDSRAHDIDRWPFAGNGGQRSRLQWSKASHSCSELGNLKSKNILVSEAAARGCMSKSVHERLKWQMRTGRASSGRDNYVRPSASHGHWSASKFVAIVLMFREGLPCCLHCP